MNLRNSLRLMLKPICNKILIFVPAGQYTTLTFRPNSQPACGHYQIVQ